MSSTGPGKWVVLDQHRRPDAMIDLVRHGAEVGYKFITWEQEEPHKKKNPGTSAEVRGFGS